MNIVRIPSFRRPTWQEFTSVTTITAGGGLLAHQRADIHHNRLTREKERGEALTMERLTPQQYVMYSALDNRPADEVKESLVASGVTHKGHDYSDADSFHIETVYSPTGNPVKDAVRIKKKSLRLDLYKGKKLELGRRGGGGAPSEELEALLEETLLEDKPEMEARGDRYSPNISYEISEQLLEDPRPVAYSFTATVPYRTPDSVFYVCAFFLGVGGVFLYEYVKRRLSKPTASRDSQQSDSRLEETVSVEETTRMQGAGKGLEAGEGPAKEGTPEVFLETIKSCRRKAITKKDAVYILVTYYGFSEEKALELLR